MHRKFELRLFVLLFIVSLIQPALFGTASSFAMTGYVQDNVYLTVISASAARINWPVYEYSGYTYVLQVKIDESGFEPLGEYARTVTEYDYTGAKASSVYVFRVMLRETRSGREEAYYNEIIYRPAGAYLQAPSALSLEQLSPDETQVSWIYSESAAYETEIWRRRGAETEYALIAVAPAGVNRFIDSAVEPDTFYRYRIRAKYGDAVYSAYIEASVRSAIDAPQITEIYAASPSSVYVEWTASADATRYRLERRLKGTMEYAAVTTLTNNRTYYTDNGVIPGERYYYRVMAVSQDGSGSLYSDEVEVTAFYIEMAQSITAIATGDYRIELSWADLGDKESTYEIWRSDEQYPGWSLLDISERNATSYIDARVGPLEGYIYKIRARSADYGNVSRFSAEARAATIFVEAPTGLRQTNAQSSSVDLSWKDNSANETAFYIERRSGHAGQWSRVATIGANITERQGLSAPASSAYYFRVGAYSSGYGSIAYSDPILADNGFQVSIRSSSYSTDSGVETAAGAGGASAGGSSASGGGAAGAGTGAGADIGEAQLDSRVINELAKRKIVAVDGGAIVGGGEPITRGEFVAMLTVALDTDEKPLGSFDDVKQGHPYYEEIMIASRLGFAKPESGNMFYPDRIITRAEMVGFVFDSLLANGTPLPAHGVNALRPFPDKDEVPAALLPQTRSVFGERIMIGIGMPTGRIIGIDRESTREQAALVVYRYIKWLDAITA